MHLLSLVEQCDDQPDFLALLGRLELANERPKAALLNLERAVMLDPYDGVAQVDYAEALYLTGSVDLALAINAELIALDSLPTSVEQELKRRQLAWSVSNNEMHAFEDTESSIARHLVFDLGYSQNLNNGAALESIDLSLPDIVYRFVLEDDLQAQAGGFARALYLEEEENRQRFASLSRSVSGWRDRMVIGAARKVPSNLRGVVSEVYSGQLEFLQGEFGLDSTAQLNLVSPQWLRQGELTLMAGYSGSSDPDVSSVLLGGARYDLGWKGINWRTSFGVRTQYEVAVSQRPGGDLSTAGLTLGASFSLGGGTLSVAQELAYARSAEGYSVLLANGSKLENVKRTQVLSYTIPVSSAIGIRLSAQKLVTSSNLDIFERDHSEYMLSFVFHLD